MSSNDTLIPSTPVNSIGRNIAVGITLSILVLVTIAGNILVLVAIWCEKKLQTVFNMYIVNLALTDLLVAITGMFFYTVDTALGYWPYGEFMCGVWIFFDYGMTFASVFTLLVISIDRFWSVSWSLHYRRNNNKKKCVIAIAIVWIIMLVVWLPPCITDRINNSIPLLCIWEPSKNTIFVIVVALIGHHGSCGVLIFCYIRVFMFMRKRVLVAPKRNRQRKQVTPSRSYSITADELISKTDQTVVPTVTQSKLHENQLKPPPESYNEGANPSCINNNKTASSLPKESEIIVSKAKSGDRERRAFVTLTYILVGYAICWIPFHVVFDIAAINPNLVPDLVYKITFWLGYVNSTINPFLYNFSSSDFRRAFRRIITCSRPTRESILNSVTG